MIGPSPNSDRATPSPGRHTLWQPTGRPEAARILWPPPATGSDRDEERGALRRGGMLRGGIGLVIGALVLRFLHPIAGGIVLGLSALTLLAALFSPAGVYRALHRGLERFGRFVGRLLSWVLLPPLYALFFVPFGQLRRRGERDRLRRRFEKEARSYWIERPTPPPGETPYERQF